MSFQAMAWAVKQKVGNATGKAILLMLANYADEQGECFPSQKRLAAECECSIATVARWVKHFEERGILSRSKQYGEGGYRRADRLRLVTELPSTELPSAELPNSKSNLTRHSDRAEPITEPIIDSSLRSESSAWWDEFWSAYPHKVGKADAAKAFKRATGRVDRETMMAGLRRYIAKTDDRPWCNPSTWLNQDRWSDQPAVQPQRGRQPRPRSASDFGHELLQEIENGRSNENSIGHSAAGLLPFSQT